MKKLTYKPKPLHQIRKEKGFKNKKRVSESHREFGYKQGKYNGFFEKMDMPEDVSNITYLYLLKCLV
jgi:hypothetical protein